MQGTIRKRILGYQWMRVGSAEAWFSGPLGLVSLICVVFLAFGVHSGLPRTGLRPVIFTALYLAAAAVYVNFGVWIHEQLHCLAFRGTVHEKRASIGFERKYLVALHGYYRVRGPLGYPILKRALLGPLILAAGWLLAGGLGAFVLPGWWFPLLATLAVISVTDMVHDLYWLWQIRSIGGKGRYWDNGHVLEVVWKT